MVETGGCTVGMPVNEDVGLVRINGPENHTSCAQTKGMIPLLVAACRTLLAYNKLDSGILAILHNSNSAIILTVVTNQRMNSRPPSLPSPPPASSPNSEVKIN